MRKLSPLPFLLLAFLLLASEAMAQTLPIKQSLFINEFTPVLSDQAKVTLREKLTASYSTRQQEITLVIIPSMSQYGFSGTIESFSGALFKKWNVGAQQGDGILIVVSMKDRAMRIELGESYPSYASAQAKDIIDNTILPYFKAGDYEQGIVRGVKDVADQISTTAKAKQFKPQKEPKNGNFFIVVGGVLAATLSLILSLFGFKKYRRQRQRICSLCQGEMQLLDDTQEDHYLTEGQKTEEVFNAIQYDVWHCPNDNHIQICDYNTWFSGFCTCKSCNNKTVSSTSKTIRSATTTSTGLKRINYNCQHCGKDWSEDRIISEKSKSSGRSKRSRTSSSSRSSGGGASGSW